VSTAIIESDDGVRVSGPLTLATIQPLLKDPVVRSDGGEVRIDLSGVTEADSSAVGLLLAWARDAADGGRRLRFANLPPNLKSLIALYGVGAFIPSV